MDTVTHALFGAGISDCWFRKRLGPVATPFALLAAAAPDIDAVTYLVSPETAWATHRGYTHAFLVLAVAGPILGSLGWLIAKRSGPWLLWTLLAWACLFSHTILDLATSWGTMPFLPFSNARISWDILPIIDAFMTAVLLACFVANRILRWEWVQTFLNPIAYPIVHKHPRRQRAADWIAAISMVLVAAYFCVGWLQNRQTVRIAREELAAAGFAPVEVRALPILLTYIAYEVVARDAEGAVRKANYSSWAGNKMAFAEFQPPRGELAELAMNARQGRLFSWYSQGMLGALPPEQLDDGWRLSLVDRRFATPTDLGKPRFTMEFVFDGQKRIASARAGMAGFKDVRIGDELEALWFLTRYGNVGGPDDSAPR